MFSLPLPSSMLKLPNHFRRLRWFGSEARFSKGRKIFSGLKANLKIKTCWIVSQFIAHKPISFALLTDSFIMSFSKLLEPWSWMQNTTNTNSFSAGPKSYWDLRNKPQICAWTMKMILKLVHLQKGWTQFSKQERSKEKFTAFEMCDRPASYYTFCCSLRENTHSFAWKGDQQRKDTFVSAKKQTFAHKSDSITIFEF